MRKIVWCDEKILGRFLSVVNKIIKTMSGKKVGLTLGILSLSLFFVCMAWGSLLGTAALKDLHVQLMQIFYPGFSFAVAGIILGAIEAFVYGWFIGVVYVWLCKKICHD